MTGRQRVVVDTNVLISRLLLPESVPGRAVRNAVNKADLLVSDETLDELAEVLSRPKFDHYVTVRDRQEFIRLLVRVAERVPIVSKVCACRDSRDDKFLELAINGEAGMIVTGDDDLLALNPFRGIAIQRPSHYLSTE